MLTLANLPLPVSYEAYSDLCCLLPDYPGDTDDARAHRIAVAMAGLADLYPADAFQARLAAKVIAADAHATDSLALANRYRADFEKHRQSLTQATSMMRQMQHFYRTLLDCQRQRQQPGARAGALILEAWLRDCAEREQADAPAGAGVEPQAGLALAPLEWAPAQTGDAAAQAAPVAATMSHTDTTQQPTEPAPIPLGQPDAVATAVPPAIETPQAAAATARADTAQPPAPVPFVQPDAASAASASAIETLPPAADATEPAALRPVSVAPAQHAAEPSQPDPLRQAEACIQRLGVFAAMIRVDGRVSPRVRAMVPEGMLPTDPAVIHALVHGDSAVLCAMDDLAPLLTDDDAEEDADLLAA